MCIAILNTSGVIDESTFRVCWDQNPDGGGIAYTDGSNLKVYKEMHSVEKLYTHYLRIRQDNTLPMILHFRIATSGSIDKENCHPFEVHPGLVMAHNGIIEHVEPTEEINDTRLFVDLLKGLPDDFLDNPAICQLISVFIGYSKLIFLDRYGEFRIINDELGHWDKAHRNWFSNHSYCRPPVNVKEYDRTQSSADNNTRWQKYFEQQQRCACCAEWTSENDLSYDRNLNANICRWCWEFLG
ncbi:MAG TPA: class II glutamine amidotransferase [Chitinophaga sp.]|uniref:class II glutamine amidotransferase n=1 Tax=Chitinophaga sp. TaxID=1869181 RepID=UPI002B65942C|nr:class II glutamine amidotransferase [Chitinophaga sp.]HVI43429.1 class II glutamine amidotransferase [Chitinophaga sp.]